MQLAVTHLAVTLRPCLSDEGTVSHVLLQPLGSFTVSQCWMFVLMFFSQQYDTLPVTSDPPLTAVVLTEPPTLCDDFVDCKVLFLFVFARTT